MWARRVALRSAGMQIAIVDALNILHVRATPRWHMLDLFFIAITVAFFAVTIAYVHGCDRLRR